MAEDWLIDVRKYAANADENVVQAIVRYCGIALQSRDGQLVAMSDKKERETVRENYLKKKLGLTQSDAELDEAVLAVGQRMKEDRTKNRVTVCYLLAEHFGVLNAFGGVAGAAAGAASLAGAFGGGNGDADKAEAPKAAAHEGSSSAAPLAAAGLAGAAGVGAASASPAASAPEPAKVEADTGGSSAAPLAAAGLAGAAGIGAASISAATPEPVRVMSTPEPIPAPAPEPTYATSSYDGGDDEGGGIWGWLKWLLLAALLLAVLFFLLRGCSNQEATPVVDDTATEAKAEDTAAKVEEPKVEAEAAIAPAPTGSGVVASERDGKPMLKVYFDTAKTNLPADFDKVAAVIKTYADKNPDAKFAVAGFNSPTGSAAGNERLSKGRADNVGAALQKLGVAAGAVELVKPAAATQGSGEDAEARRVEVTVK
jgi:outer membrane protein OmpA-like peptidoglycan-associated protein